MAQITEADLKGKNKAELEQLAQTLGVTVAGTGQGGGVTVADLTRALVGAEAPPQGPTDAAQGPQDARGFTDVAGLSTAELQAELERRNAEAAGGDEAKVEAQRKDNARIAKLMHNRDHLRECPAADDADVGRFEVYPHEIPGKPDEGRAPEAVTVARCITCGGTTVIRKSLDDVLEAATAASAA